MPVSRVRVYFLVLSLAEASLRKANNETHGSVSDTRGMGRNVLYVSANGCMCTVCECETENNYYS